MSKCMISAKFFTASHWLIFRSGEFECDNTAKYNTAGRNQMARFALTIGPEGGLS